MASVLAASMQAETDASFEESVRRDPYSVRVWLAYAAAKTGSPAEVRNAIHARALSNIPGSYKLWKACLEDRLRQTAKLAITDGAVVEATRLFETALATMHKMPRIWMMYLRYMTRQFHVTATRQAFDRALRALPVTQHQHIWPIYQAFALQDGLPVSTGTAVLRRLVQFDPSAREDAVEYLLARQRPAEAARQLAVIVDDPTFRSKRGATRHALWMQLCELLAAHPREIRAAGGLPLAGDEAAAVSSGSLASGGSGGGRAASLAAATRVERVFRSGLSKFSDEVGRLWCALANYHVRLGNFERARDVYEEALGAVRTVRDFAAVFDAYSEFEEALLEARMEQQVEAEADAEDNSSDPGADTQAGGAKASRRPPTTAAGCAAELLALRSGGNSAAAAAGVGGSADSGVSRVQALASDVELRLERLDGLVSRRPLLLSAVLLRQNPHNVREWLRRADIYAERRQWADVARTLTEGAGTVDPVRATGGKPRALWTRLAREYEESAVRAAGSAAPDLSGARRVLERAVAAPASDPADVAAVWCSWGEMEVRHGQLQAALRVMQRAVTPPRTAGKRRVFGSSETASLASSTAAASSSSSASSATSSTASVAGVAATPQALAHRSPRIWALYLDLEEQLGSPDTVAAAYERALDLKVATPRMVLNFTQWLAARSFHEKAFRAYERALAVFPWPHAGELWSAYITAFVERYKGTKLERARALFEEALSSAPPEASKDLWLLLAAVEEQFGSVRRALAALDKGAKQVARADRAALYRRWAAVAEQFYGVVQARAVWEEAAEAVADSDAADVCVQFAALEAKLGEVDRARAVLSHGAQFAAAAADGGEALWAAWKELELDQGTKESYRIMTMRRRAVEAAEAKAGGYTEAELAMRASAMNRAAGGDGAVSKAQKRRREAAQGAAATGPAASAAATEAEAEQQEQEDDVGGAEEPEAKASRPADTAGVAAEAAGDDDDELDIEM